MMRFLFLFLGRGGRIGGNPDYKDIDESDEGMLDNEQEDKSWVERIDSHRIN